MSETISRILRFNSFSPNAADTSRTETGVKACGRCEGGEGGGAVKFRVVKAMIPTRRHAP